MEASTVYALITVAYFVAVIGVLIPFMMRKVSLRTLLITLLVGIGSLLVTNLCARFWFGVAMDVIGLTLWAWFYRKHYRKEGKKA
jgi:hypothetical protein